MYKTSTSSYASKGFDFCLKSCLISNASDFLPAPICVLHSNFWYLHINSLLEWRFYYFHMFCNPVNQFMHLNPLPAVKTFTWTGAERHAWRNRYWRSRGQIVYRRNRRNGARLLQRTLIYWRPQTNLTPPIAWMSSVTTDMDLLRHRCIIECTFHFLNIKFFLQISNWSYFNMANNIVFHFILV